MHVSGLSPKQCSETRCFPSCRKHTRPGVSRRRSPALVQVTSGSRDLHGVSTEQNGNGAAKTGHGRRLKSLTQLLTLMDVSSPILSAAASPPRIGRAVLNNIVDAPLRAGRPHPHPSADFGREQKRGVRESHPALALMKDRIRTRSKPGGRHDSFKLGLVVEGGGMRGVVTGAMLMQLLEMGCRDAFDAVYGASAGAINATYFLSGQRCGLSIYMEDIANTTFINFRRLFRGQPVMDLDYLLDYVIREVKPLDFSSVLNSSIPLKVVASSLDTLSSVVLDGFHDPEDLIDCLKASANVPEIVGPPRLVRGHRLVDAAVFEPVPVKAAIRDGCTHILALCSRPAFDNAVGWKKYIKSALTHAAKGAVFSPSYMKEARRMEKEAQMHNGLPLDDYLIQALQGYPTSHVAQGNHLSVRSIPQLAYEGHSPYSGSNPGVTYGVSDLPNSEASRNTDVKRQHLLEPSTASWSSGTGVSPSLFLPQSSCSVYPVYPGPGAGFAPICTDVNILERGKAEGFSAVKTLVDDLIGKDLAK